MIGKMKHVLGAIFVFALLLVGMGCTGKSGAGLGNNTTAALSGAADKIYVAMEGTGEIAVIDAKTNSISKRISLSKNKSGTIVEYMPHNIQVAPDGKSVWVTANVPEGEMAEGDEEEASDTADADTEAGMGGIEEEDGAEADNDEVIVIDPVTDAIVERIEIGEDLHLSHVALTPDSSYAIAASQEKGMMYKINAVSFMVEEEVATKEGAQPHGLRISPDGKTAYVAMIGGKSIGVLDIASFTLSYVPLKGAAVQTGVTADGKYALASVYDAKSLAVYDISSANLSYVDLPKEAKGPVQIYTTPDSRYVYVADQGYYFGKPVGEIVYKIDLMQMKVVQAIDGGVAPHGVVVSQDGKFVYVTNLLSNDVSVIDVGAGKETARIDVGKMPNGISLWYAAQ